MTAPTASADPRLRANPLERVLAIRLPFNAEVGSYVALFIAAVALRFWDLGSRALHHDESIHAQWSWKLLQGDYTHSPIFHGPFYYHVQGAMFFLFGTSDYTSRLSAAIFGAAIVLLPLLLRRWLGTLGTIAAVAFLALSPTTVYYSRFFREDIYMAFFVLLMVVCTWRYVAEGRERWLLAFALAFTGAVTTKEGTFLTVAVFLLYLDLWVGSELARQTLRARGVDTPERRFFLSGANALWAVPVVAFWPFLGRLRRAMDWDTLPRPADVIILLGTITLPLLTPVLRGPLESVGLLDKDIALADGKFTSRLDWQNHLLAGITRQDRVALFGLFAVTTSAAAFVGLQWRPKLWAIAFGSSAVIYLTLMTFFWTNLDGLVSGPWGSLDYWAQQQNEHRGDQPWFYYFMLMPSYEFLTLAICIGGAWWSVIRGDAFSRFLAFWLVGQWLALSYGSEKMPWLNTHLAIPSGLLAAYTVNRAWNAWRDKPRTSTAATTLFSIAGLGAGALLLIAYLPGEPIYHLLRVAILIVAVGGIAYGVRPYGRSAIASAAVFATIGALSVFSLQTMARASFTRGDVPKDLLIYTQSSPAIPDLMREIERLAEVTGKGRNLPIAVDGSDSFAWPWAWYLRDYKCVSYADLSSTVNLRSGCAGEDQPYAVLLVNSSNVSRADDAIAQSGEAFYGTPRTYPHRWWFNEGYKSAMSVEKGQDCIAKSGGCGLFTGTTIAGFPNLVPNVKTLKTIRDGVFHDGWVKTWLLFGRDHNPDAVFGTIHEDRECRSCGSVDAVAYFPAAFDAKTGAYTAKPVELPRPSTDASGRPVFGARGGSPGQFSAPADIERDADGNLYVIDHATKRLQKFDAAGNFLASVSVRINSTDPNEQSEPWGLAIAADGTIAVADTFGWRIRMFDKELKPGITFGKPETPQPGVAPGPYDLFGPRDLAFDAAGNLWVTDTGHDRLVVYTRAGEFVRSLGTEGSGPGQFNEPVGLTIGADGAIYVADMYNSRVVILAPDGTFKSSFPVDGWGGKLVDDKPYLEALRDGRLALAVPFNAEVRIYSADGTLRGSIAGDTEPLSRPYGMVETPDGKLWIVEGGASRVRLFALP